ncbi:MAG: hypothetical protein USCAAHI_00069 [Beijerinckiaceae bacterium]|nr:MAG: hypothetical protein USCAAHI_00069 [Beijerinckiaceae bacterium]
MPTEMHAWLDMAINVIAKTGFPLGLDKAGLTKAFIAHTDAAKAAIPAHQLLLYQVKDGWTRCAFLGLPVPADPFPRTNDRGEFWERDQERNKTALGRVSGRTAPLRVGGRAFRQPLRETNVGVSGRV